MKDLIRILLLAVFAYSVGYVLGIVSAKADPIQIAIVDTGFDKEELDKAKTKLCDDGHFDAYTFKEELPKEWHSTAHGTKMAILADRASNGTACVIGIKGLTSSDENGGILTTAKALQHIAKLPDVKIVSLSYTGDTFSYSEYEALRVLNRQNKKIFMAAGNNKTNLDKNSEYDNSNKRTTICTIFPACYLGLNATVVGGLDQTGNKLWASNWGSIVKDWALGAYTGIMNNKTYTSDIFGSSPATATAAGKCAYKLSAGKKCE